METPVIQVAGEVGTYPVVIRPGALSDALPAFVREHAFSRAAVVTNTTIAPLYGETLVRALPDACLIMVPDGEAYKTLDTLRTLYDALLAEGANRSSLIIGLGGGVIGDLAGFAAATFMRGVAFIQAPTSLLAMVDASIGGKVGVDLPQGKNLVGAFKDPLAVFADTAALGTLPLVEFRSGMAEVVKAALVGDAALWDQLRGGDVSPGKAAVTDIITRAAAVKVAVVAQDRLEHGPRAFLNLGHTFGHALEQVTHYAWRHGEAVAWGIAAAARLSARLGLCPPALITQVEDVLRDMGLPVRAPDIEPAALWDAMQHDKKWHRSATFVLLAGVGQPVIRSDVPRDLVLDVLEELREAS